MNNTQRALEARRIRTSRSMGRTREAETNPRSFATRPNTSGDGGRGQNRGAITATGNDQREQVTNNSVDKPKPETWRKSEAKKLLGKLLRNESSWVYGILEFDADRGINEIDTLEAIHYEEPLFGKCNIQNFKTNFKNLKARIDKDRKNSEFDQDALNKEKLKYPSLSMLQASHPRWNHSEAKSRMEEDVKAKKHLNMLPIDLRETRPEYLKFEKHIFRDILYAEVRKQTGEAFWVYKRNKKMRKKTVAQEEEVDELANILGSMNV